MEVVQQNAKNATKKRAVANWLLVGVIMIMIQILLGGITRLTGSGLSITEWNPLFGFIPPISQDDWQKSFEQYQQIAQFKYLNSHFTLEEFKSIFFWEWFHRVWARLLGFVFLIGFVFFIVKKYFDKQMVVPLIVLFVLGAMQGLVGWIMVKSGLNDTDLYVNHIKLAMHFIAAIILLVYTMWFALKLYIPDAQKVSNTQQYLWSIFLMILLFVQLTYGAFMSGLKAAMAAATWPTINGDWIPNLAGKSLVNHPIGVHFMHRGIAYVLFILVIIAFFKAKKLPRLNGKWSSAYAWPAILVVLQLLLGIFTVISAPSMVMGKFGGYELLALTHQGVAMLLTMALVVHIYIYSPKSHS